MPLRRATLLPVTTASPKVPTQATDAEKDRKAVIAERKARRANPHVYGTNGRPAHLK